MSMTRWLDDSVDCVTRSTTLAWGLRTTVVGTMAVLAVVTLGTEVSLAWLFAVAAAEAGIWKTTRRIRQGLERNYRQRARYLAAVLWASLVWSGLAIMLWFDGRAACLVAAVCILITQMLHAQVFASRSPAALVAVATPPLISLLALAVFKASGTWSEQALLAGTVVVTVSYMAKVGFDNAERSREREAARVRAEQAASAKGEFLANMSHELRTPLTSVLGFARLAAEQGDYGPATAGYIQRIDEAGRALLCAVNDILDFSKIEAGQLQIAREPVEVDLLLQRTLDLFAPQAAAKRLDLVFSDGALADLRLELDPDRLRQILLNLIGNAVKFTASGTVALSATYAREDGVLAVSVIDTGAGVEPDKLGRLFRRFSQVAGAAAGSGGTGLGLAICKGLVEAMGGEIGVESTVGQGSCFWFRIPAAVSAEPVLEAVDEENAPLLAGLRVLVVDDHAANRELASLLLVGAGANVQTEEDGESAIAACTRRRFDVLLLDLRMPEIDGFETLRRMRSLGAAPGAVLAFTADVHEMTPERLAEHGLSGLVAKPIDAATLLMAVAGAAPLLRPGLAAAA